MIRDGSNPRPAGPATATLLLAVALLVTGGAGGAVLAGCTSDTGRPPPGSSSSAGPSGTPSSAGSPAPWSVATPGTTGPHTPGDGGTSGSVPRADGPASQTDADASRDGVDPSIAALPLTARVKPVPKGPVGSTKVTVSDGVWLISRPVGSPGSYAELLHLDSAGRRVLRSYPFPRLAPRWVLVTPQAVYCGRAGDAETPDTMICRVDRATGDLRVLVSADLKEEASFTEAELSGRPGTWIVDDRNFAADFGNVPEAGTELTFRSGAARLRLSPDTLGVLGS
ncbi:MAG: hypothetical protein QG622_2690 [Actinomycetota bacterium]|nr:hypothetical protein [Actinomycetota bacterium]